MHVFYIILIPNKPPHKSQSLCLVADPSRSSALCPADLYGGFRFVIGVPPVLTHFERWDFP